MTDSSPSFTAANHNTWSHIFTPPYAFTAHTNAILCLGLLAISRKFFLSLWRCGPTRAMASSFLRFRDHTHDASQSVGLLWTSDQLSQRPLLDNTHNTHNRQTSMPGGIRTHDRSRRAAADLRLRPRGHWDRQSVRSCAFKILNAKLLCLILCIFFIFIHF